MITDKEFVVKDEVAFKLTVKVKKCMNPDTLYSVDFLQESLDTNGDVYISSVYNYFLTEDEIKTLAAGLLS
jgi:hypothetical protein